MRQLTTCLSLWPVVPELPSVVLVELPKIFAEVENEHINCVVLVAEVFFIHGDPVFDQGVCGQQ